MLSETLIFILNFSRLQNKGQLIEHEQEKVQKHVEIGE